MVKIVEFLIGFNSRRWAIAALSLLALVLVYTGTWVYVATHTVTSAEQWTADRRAEGYRVQYTGLRATGFPFWVRLELRDLVFDAPKGGPSGAAPWGWEGENLIVATRPWRPGRLSLRLSGKQAVSYPVGDRRLTFNGTVAGLAADLTVTGGAPDIIAVSIDSLVLASPQARAGRIAVASADLLWQQLSENTAVNQDAATMALDVTASGIELPSSVASPLGNGIRNLHLAARLLGELPHGPGAPLPEALEIWRDGGGTIEVDQLVLRHGLLGLWADGTLALDRDLQPVGAFTARVQGFFDIIDAFTRQGMIGEREAVTAKLLLGVFSQRPKNGGPATLNLALTIQRRNLYAGPVKLMRLPLLHWRRGVVSSGNRVLLHPGSLSTRPGGGRQSLNIF